MTEPVLLDTCACIWTVTNSSMNEAAVRLVNDATASSVVFVSPFTAWGISKLYSTARLDLDFHPHIWFGMLTRRPGVNLAPLDAEVLIESNLLPGPLHRDPSDRILIATARRLGAVLITRDKRILDYAAAGHLKACRC